MRDINWGWPVAFSPKTATVKLLLSFLLETSGTVAELLMGTRGVHGSFVPPLLDLGLSRARAVEGAGGA